MELFCFRNVEKLAFNGFKKTE
ncbi:hypothetical protein SCB49_07352 [unidentified eubacterium SCB49]|nr:hypothetical protein SCB49_07352 [unidentified eubacterium SCB49]